MAKELLQLQRTNQSRFGLCLSTNLSTLSWATKAGSVVPNSLQKKKSLQQVQLTLAKAEIIYPKNVRAKVAMDFT